MSEREVWHSQAQITCLYSLPICCHQVAVSRSNHQFPNDHDSEGSNKPSKEDRAKLLLDWALDDFKPEGPEAFETSKGGFCICQFT